MATVLSRKKKSRPSFDTDPDSYPGSLPPKEEVAPASATPPTPPTPPTEPTLQETVKEQVPTAPTAEPDASDTSDEMTAILTDLRHEIASNGKAILGWFVRRGALVRRAIDVKIRKATNNPTRIKLRKSGLDAAQLTALDAYDPSCEPSPNADNWLRLHWLVTLHPEACEIKTVAAALVCANMITRIDPPTRYHDAETWEVKRPYVDHIGTVVGRVIAENLDRDDTKAVIDALSGIGAGVAPKVKASADNVKTARQSAARIAKQMIEGKINPGAFFDELKNVAGRYGWMLAPNTSGNGTTMVKTGR